MLSLALVALSLPQQPSPTTFAVRGKVVHTMVGAPIDDGVVLIEAGKITRVGKASEVVLPAGVLVRSAAVVTPGLIDARATVGLTGVLNVPHDQDHLDKSDPIQPELRAIDAYNAKEELVGWVRSYGITTVHTGHSAGALVSGQTMVVKTHGRTVEQDVVVPFAMLSVGLNDAARGGGKAPGTRAKSVAMLRERLQKAREREAKRVAGQDVAVDLGLDALGKALAGEVPLLVAAHRSHDILSALRVGREFGVRIVLDGAAEAYTVLPELKEAGVWTLPHPPMARTGGDLANGTMALPKLLAAAELPFALQSGYEGYVPKTRVVLFEAGVAVGHGLAPDAALRALTVDAARLLGLDGRLGSLVVGKDADLAMFDGDPFEYTTHCTGVVIDGIAYEGERHTGGR
jgi:imidazolonepropionase-like amidohydrolase